VKRADKGVYKRKWRNKAGEMVTSDTWTIEWFVGSQKMRLATGLKSKSEAVMLRTLKIAESVNSAKEQNEKLQEKITLNDFVKTVYFSHVFENKVGQCIDEFKHDILAAVRQSATDAEFEECKKLLNSQAAIRNIKASIISRLEIICTDIADAKTVRAKIETVQNPVERAVLMIMRFKMREVRSRIDLYRLVSCVFGELYINDINGDAIKNYRRSLVNAGLSASTRNKRCGLIKHIFAIAKDFNYISAEKLADVRIDRQEQEDNERHIETTQEERAKIIEAAKKVPYMWELIVFALYTGLRRNKIFRLKWDDVFLDGETAYYCLGKDKNKESARTPLSPQAIEVLKCREKARKDGLPWVFFNASTHAPYDNVDKAFFTIMTEVGRPDIIWHDLRHIFCTMVADTGVGLYDLMAVSGHKDPKMAMRYINRSLVGKAKTVAGLK